MGFVDSVTDFNQVAGAKDQLQIAEVLEILGTGEFRFPF